MPALNNITVKKHDGTTDVIYYGLNPGSSREPSSHKAPPLALNDDTRPEFRTTVRRNGNKEWIVTYWFMYPYATTSSDTGITSVRRRIFRKVVDTIPADVPSSAIQEFVSQSGNILVNSNTKLLATDGSNYV